MLNQFHAHIDMATGKEIITRKFQINFTEQEINRANSILLKTITAILVESVEIPEESELDQVITPLTSQNDESH